MRFKDHALKVGRVFGPKRGSAALVLLSLMSIGSVLASADAHADSQCADFYPMYQHSHHITEIDVVKQVYNAGSYHSIQEWHAYPFVGSTTHPWKHGC